jgi:hypothetical protein
MISLFLLCYYLHTEIASVDVAFTLLLLIFARMLFSINRYKPKCPLSFLLNEWHLINQVNLAAWVVNWEGIG